MPPAPGSDSQGETGTYPVGEGHVDVVYLAVAARTSASAAPEGRGLRGSAVAGPPPGGDGPRAMVVRA
jgi:hypothetical protein